MNLTPVAIREGQAFAQTEFMNRPTSFDHAEIPHAVFAQPPVGVVLGMTSKARKSCWCRRLAGPVLPHEGTAAGIEGGN